MKRLAWMQLFSVCLFVLGFCGGICVVLAVEKFFGIRLPVWILDVIVLSCVLLDAGIRISLWKRRKEILTEKEQSKIGPKIYFATAGAELLLAVIYAGFLLSS